MVTHRFATARNTTGAAAATLAPFTVLTPEAVMGMQCMAAAAHPAMYWGGGMAAIYAAAYRRAQSIVLAQQASARIDREIVFAMASARPNS